MHRRGMTKAERQAEARQLEIENNKGFVYLMRSENGYYKIGTTKDVAARLRSINHGIPIDIELVHSFYYPICRLAESFLHDKYEDKRFRWEWFALGPKDVEWIKSIKDNDQRVKKGIRKYEKKWLEEVKKTFEKNWQERRMGLRK